MVAALGVVLWRGAGGFLPSERQLVWRLPVAYGEVRRLQLQVWAEGALLKNEEVELPVGLDRDPTTRLALSRGPHQGVVVVWLAGGGVPTALRLAFDPGADDTIILEGHLPDQG